MLAALGDALPDSRHIVVVPGNHDVAWGTAQGSRERYSAFLNGVCEAGYVTPLLDGIDYDGDEPRSTAGPLLIGPDFVVIAVNSADMCGVIEPFPQDLEAELERHIADGLISQDLQSQIRRVRMYDMPRISPRQMAALAGMLDQVPAGRVRIAALHHQLVPVREEEEVKPFESIVNVRAFSEFLAEARIDVIAHGHKHADQVQTVALGGAPGEHRSAVVASCGTIGGAVGTGNEVAKLIKIDSTLPTLRRVEILSVPAVGAGTKLQHKISSIYDRPTWRATGATQIAVISGATVTDVHEQLLEVARRAGGKPMRDVICVVDLGQSAMAPPATYRWPADSAAALPEWFNDIVDWWLDPKRGDGKPFTHGQRLRGWSGNQPRDQLEAIISILGSDTGTSRGVAVLMNPSMDDIADKTIEFPSFSLLHLWIADGALHCSAFFRKQEMTYWWAVNATEIARIQAQVLHRLRPSQEHLTAGAIRMYASQAVFSDRLPKVNVPRVDRQFWHDPDSLRVLAVAVADGDMPGRDDAVGMLLSLMDDWAPEAEVPPTDGAAVPTRGMTALADMLVALADSYPESPARDIGEALRDMDEANALYVQERETGDPSRRYTQWRTQQRRRLTRIRELLAPEAKSPGNAAASSSEPNGR